jgi:hypothetical protein
MKKIQKITLAVFLVAMLVCVDLALFLIWSVPKEFTVVNRLLITFFVLGLASFLIWIVTIILDVRDKIDKK